MTLRLALYKAASCKHFKNLHTLAQINFFIDYDKGQSHFLYATFLPAKDHSCTEDISYIFPAARLMSNVT